MSSSTPNAEQMLAIQHFGGVLLSAGAGAGKTFVLREHFIYLINEFIKSVASEQVESKEAKIKCYLEGLVFMTFTKKAAGELHIRIRDRVAQEAITRQDFQVVKKHLGKFFVGTIHGFCHKLITEGAVQVGDASLDVVDQKIIDQKVVHLFHCAIDELRESSSREELLSLNVLYKNQKSLQDTFLKVFSSPEIRLAWLSDIKQKSIDDSILNELAEVFDFSKVFSPPAEYDQLAAYTGQAFASYLEEWVGLCNGLGNKITFNNIQDYVRFLDKTISTPRKDDAKIQFGDYFEYIKSLKKFFRSHGDSLLMYQQHQDGEILIWHRTLNRIFEYINDRYYKLPGISFADLEFSTLGALRRNNCKKGVIEKYRYFVIDEFQDTSATQMEIVERIVGGDTKRIFCVGDPKQAIYGFRGGSLSVFKNFQERATLNLNLTNNYRSLKEIINFNNDIFEYIFKLGPDFEGIDPHTVPYVRQDVPPTAPDELGAIQKFVVQTSSPEIDLEEVESSALTNIIRNLCQNRPGNETICILFRKLAPARRLIESLVANNVGFTAQTKIEFGDDPVLAIFSVAMQLLNDIQADSKKSVQALEYPTLITQSYLSILGVKRDLAEVREIWESFIKDCSLLNTYYAYVLLLRKISIFNSRYEENTQAIKLLFKAAGNNVQRCLLLLNESKSNAVKVEIRFGKNAERVQIMTVHASKGLQFDHILLGGLFTSTRKPPNTSKIGLLPSSFKWHVANDHRAEFKTPDMIYENELEKQKEFSESKRLFYVAFTRAIKSISYVDCVLDKTPVDIPKSSWLQALRLWSERTENADRIKRIELANSNDAGLPGTKNDAIPLIYRTKLGLEISETFVTNKLVMLPELSVTKMSSILNCSRKFYLEHVLKLDVEITGEELNDFLKPRENEPQDLVSTSSAQRGSDVHKAIELLFLHNRVIPRSILPGTEMEEILQWVLDQTKGQILTHDFMPERDLRYNFFGTMITGIPDLILRPRNQSDQWEIWDFKTGRFSNDKNKIYWFQLMAYVLGLKNLAFTGENSKISLKIVYVDSKKIFEKTDSVGNFVNDLFSQLSEALDYNQMGLDHCSKCPFNSLCH